MPSQPYVDVYYNCRIDLTAGLTDGSDYLAQNVSGRDIEYTNYATDPTGDDVVGWQLVREYRFIAFTADTANPVWVRTGQGVGRLAVSDA